MTIVLDAGALIAVDRRDRMVGAMLRVAQQQQVAVRSSAGAVAQVWRDGARQANLARVLTGVEVAALDLAAAKRIGPVLGATGTSDAVAGPRAGAGCRVVCRPRWSQWTESFSARPI